MYCTHLLTHATWHPIAVHNNILWSERPGSWPLLVVFKPRTICLLSPETRQRKEERKHRQAVGGCGRVQQRMLSFTGPPTRISYSRHRRQLIQKCGSRSACYQETCARVWRATQSVYLSGTSASKKVIIHPVYSSEESNGGQRIKKMIHTARGTSSHLTAFVGPPYDTARHLEQRGRSFSCNHDQNQHTVLRSMRHNLTTRT